MLGQIYCCSNRCFPKRLRCWPFALACSNWVPQAVASFEKVAKQHLRHQIVLQFDTAGGCGKNMLDCCFNIVASTALGPRAVGTSVFHKYQQVKTALVQSWRIDDPSTANARHVFTCLASLDGIRVFLAPLFAP